MYCIIKKLKSHQKATVLVKNILVFTSQYENEPIRYGFSISTEKVERPPQSNYEIFIHYTLSEGKKNLKRQIKIAVVNYYDFAKGRDWDEFLDKKEFERILFETKTSAEKLKNMVNLKVAPLKKEILTDWFAIEEVQKEKKLKETLLLHEENKKHFESLWGLGTYDYIYDVYGNLKNEELLDWLTSFKSKSASSSKSQQGAKSTYKKTNQKKSSFAPAPAEAFTESEKAWLKKFYRSLAHEYHPDSGGNNEAMILLNRLKAEWDI